MHPIIYISNISPYHPDSTPEHLLDPCPNPILVNGNEEYEVESIVDSKYRYRCLHYLIKLKAWPDSNTEWLPADHLPNASEVTRDFHDHQPSRPTPRHPPHP